MRHRYYILDILAGIFETAVCDLTHALLASVPCDHAATLSELGARPPAHDRLVRDQRRAAPNVKVIQRLFGRTSAALTLEEYADLLRMISARFRSR